jgi:hypothetical protein
LQAVELFDICPIESIADRPQITQIDADSIAQILEGHYDFVGAFSRLDRV